MRRAPGSPGAAVFQERTAARVRCCCGRRYDGDRPRLLGRAPEAQACPEHSGTGGSDGAKAARSPASARSGRCRKTRMRG